jgi:muconate cycloisomerase
LRERFGDAVKLRIDANGGMKFDDAAALLEAIEPYGIDAAEQLLPMWELDAMAELARRTSIPFVADECLSDERDLMEIVRRRAAGGIQTKIAKNGGIWHIRKLWHIADAAGLRIFPGNHPSTSIAISAVAHLATAWPGALLDGPFTVGLSALGEDIVTGPLRLDGGAVQVADAPGLGVTLDEEEIRKLRAEV